MSKEMIAEKAINGHKSFLIEKESRKIPFSTWSSERKFSVEAYFDRRPGTILKLIEKETSPEPDEIIPIWLHLKKAGLPVVPFMRKTSESRVIMPNLSYDGSVFFGKNALINPQFEVDNQMLKLFNNIMFREISERAEFYVGLANENHVRLAYDDPFELLLHRDGSWQLIILDLGFVDVNKKFTKEYLEDVNLDYQLTFYQIMHELRTNFD